MVEMRVVALAFCWAVAGALWMRLYQQVTAWDAPPPRMTFRVTAPPATAPIVAAAKPARAPERSPLDLTQRLNELGTCISGNYKGGRFVVQLKTLPGGRVQDARVVQGEFLTEPERRCLSKVARAWLLPDNTPEELAVTVSL